MKVLKSTLAIVSAAAVLGVSGFAQAGATLDAVQKKGFVQCGVSDGLPGFSVPDASGKMARFATPLFIALILLVGGVIGATRMAYDYWGETVNMAARRFTWPNTPPTTSAGSTPASSRPRRRWACSCRWR